MGAIPINILPKGSYLSTKLVTLRKKNKETI